MEAHNPYSLFPVINCGPDWLTCTSKRRGVSNDLEDWAMDHLQKEFAGSGRVLPAKCLGFSGHRGVGLFVGQRIGEVMVQLSGPRCAPLAIEAIRLASNVSRIDLQVTVWTEGEQPHLATWTYKQMLAQRHGSGRPGSFKLIVGHPDGETMTINKRISDSYGRLYDKTAEARLGAPRLLWRYEVEWKRREAQSLATRLARLQCSPTSVCKLVHAWYTKKGVEPCFTSDSTRNAFEPLTVELDRDILTWFRSSVRISIQRAINKHGRDAVLDALGLSNVLQRGPTNGH